MKSPASLGLQGPYLAFILRDTRARFEFSALCGSWHSLGNEGAPLLFGHVATGAAAYALVTSQLGYCSMFLRGAALEDCPDAAVGAGCCGWLPGVGRKGPHIVSALFPLHWLPICFQAQFKGLVLTFKALCR